MEAAFAGAYRPDVRSPNVGPFILLSRIRLFQGRLIFCARALEPDCALLRVFAAGIERLVSSPIAAVCMDGPAGLDSLFAWWGTASITGLDTPPRLLAHYRQATLQVL